MFSITVFYSIQDLLIYLSKTQLSLLDFKKYFRNYNYSSAETILKISFKCGWILMDKEGYLVVTNRGKGISESNYNIALRYQLEDVLSYFNPVWGSILLKGRKEAQQFLDPDISQCFKESGLFDPLTNDIIEFWDRLCISYRKLRDKQKLEIGRKGEKLSFDHEFNRTGVQPLWQGVESNLSGFDLLSIVNKKSSAKLKIEVKATNSSLNYAKFHITRYEWETAKSSINYIFHFWLINKKPKLFVKDIKEIEKHVCVDKGKGKWESVQIPYKILS